MLKNLVLFVLKNGCITNAQVQRVLNKMNEGGNSNE